MTFQHVAWVPEEPILQWPEAEELAVQWAEERCSAEAARGVLVLNQQGAEQSDPTLRGFAQRHGFATRRSRAHVRRSGPGPVIAYSPDADTLEVATRLARGSSIVVVEAAHLFPIRGWASLLGAQGLTRPDEAPGEPDPRMLEGVEQLRFCGHNAYGPPFDRGRATHALHDLQSQGLLDRDFLVGALAARHISPRGLKQLDRLIDRL